MHCDVALRIDDRHLPAFEAIERVFGQQAFEHLLRRESLPQKLQSAGAVTAIHRRLSRNRAHPSLRPRHVVAHAEHTRRDGHAEITCRRIDRDD